MSKPQGLVQPEGLGKLIKIIHLIESRTRDLPVWNIRRNKRDNVTPFLWTSIWGPTLF
jgi:hypothetical protein